MTHWQTLLLSTLTARLLMPTPLSEVVADSRHVHSWKHHLFLKPFLCLGGGSGADWGPLGLLRAATSAGSEASLSAGVGLALKDCCRRVERKACIREKLPALVSGAAMRTLARCKPPNFLLTDGLQVLWEPKDS